MKKMTKKQTIKNIKAALTQLLEDHDYGKITIVVADGIIYELTVEHTNVYDYDKKKD